MQLGGQKSIRTALTAITATLLGSGTAGASDSGKIDSSLLIYSETKRVKAFEGVFDFARKLSERRSVGLRLTLDVLTGASPNGATPSSQVQTFTGPSGGTSYTAPAGEIPLDDTFKDQRGALDGSLQESLDRITFLNVGGHLSIEHDYASLGLNGGITRDFDRRNTTLGVSVAYNHDIVRPIGGAPVPFEAMPPPSAGGDGEGEEEGEGGGAGPGKGKDVVDVVAGVTQVLGRNTLVRANYSLNRSSGYLNDPYKLLSVVQDPNAAAPGEPAFYVYEGRPDARSKQAVFGELRRYIAGSALDLSYRYFWDDWGIKSHTADAFLRLPVGGGQSIEPHFRWYRQSEADFHAFYLVEGRPFPSHASADSRLAAFDAYTYGLQYTVPLGVGSDLRVSAEYYTQKGARGPPDAFGILARYDLFPALDVLMVRFGYSHGL
jgi:hypothetical protein